MYTHSRSVVSDSLWPHRLQPARLLCPWNFPGKNTGVGCHFLLQGIFLTQGLNLHLLCLLQADSLTLVNTRLLWIMLLDAVCIFLYCRKRWSVSWITGAKRNTMMQYRWKMRRKKRRCVNAQNKIIGNKRKEEPKMHTQSQPWKQCILSWGCTLISNHCQSLSNDYVKKNHPLPCQGYKALFLLEAQSSTDCNSTCKTTPLLVLKL